MALRHIKKYDYFDIDSYTSETGSREYYTPVGPVPSVTTILATLPTPELDEWRERVGDEEADRISKEATTIGSYMHEYVEDHLLKRTPHPQDNEYRKMAWVMHKRITMIGFRGISEVWGVEVALHYKNLYAGRSDLIGVYKGKPAIMDHKTTKFKKDKSGLKKYKLQAAAYAIAHEEMFGPDAAIDTGVLFLSHRPNEYKGGDLNIIRIDEDEMMDHKIEWTEILTDFYKGRG